MARILSRAPSASQEAAFRDWAERYLWNDRRCDNCERLLPEDDVKVHDAYDRLTGRKKPRKVFCTQYCFFEGTDSGVDVEHAGNLERVGSLP